MGNWNTTGTFGTQRGQMLHILDNWDTSGKLLYSLDDWDSSMHLLHNLDNWGTLDISVVQPGQLGHTWDNWGTEGDNWGTSWTNGAQQRQL